MSAPLEQRLVALGAALESPPTPDLVAAVTARLEPRPPRRRLARPPRRALALAFALLLLGAGAAMAITPVRHAVLDLFDLRGAKVERVPRLPPTPPGPTQPLPLGRRIPVSTARHAASFRALLPPHVRAAYLGAQPTGGRITLRTGRVQLVEFRGRATPYVMKLAGPGTHLHRLRVNGGRGVFLSGAPHQVIFEDAQGQVQPDDIHLAGDVLLWEQRDLIFRIEGAHSLREALALARSLK
jgi:hypothetical protein